MLNTLEEIFICFALHLLPDYHDDQACTADLEIVSSAAPERFSLNKPLNEQRAIDPKIDLKIAAQKNVH